MMGELIDFDAFRAEHQLEPVRIKVGGEVYDLPPSLPAMVALDIVRLQADHAAGERVPNTALEAIGKSLFGPDTFRTLVDDNRLTMPELSELIKRVMAAYSGTPMDGVPDPNREARRKAKRGRSR